MSFNLNIKRIRADLLQNGGEAPTPASATGPVVPVEGSPICHLDADAFFASVAQAADPRLRGKAIAVGGLKRGIVASASYEARAMGIYTPMPMQNALRLCPKLIVVPGHYALFEQFSRFMFSFVHDFTPNVEICSIDEGYFDLSGHRGETPHEVMEKIQRGISQALKITVTQGAGPNKIVSQIASKLHKPNGLITVRPEDVRSFMDPLPVKRMHGLGPVAQKRLEAAGVLTLRDLANLTEEESRRHFGSGGEHWRRLAQGIDPRPIVASHGLAKSYGHQETFGEDTTNEEFLRAHLRRLVDKAIERMREDAQAARTVSVRIRYSDMSETERSYTIDEPGDLPEDFYGPAEQLMKKAWERRAPLRLIAVRLTHMYKALPLVDFFTQAERERRESLQNVLTEVRGKFGPQALMRGHDAILNGERHH